MVINQETKEFWDKEIINANLIWPNEHIIRFVKRNFHDRNSVILDFGCGLEEMQLHWRWKDTI